MNFPFFIAKRYFSTQKSSNFVHIISWVSLFGVAIGTAALILVLSVFNGFENLVLSMYNSFDQHLKIIATEGKVFIQNLIGVSNNSIILRDILGKIILTSDSRNSLVSLDISHLEDGIYFIEIASNNGVRIEKVILAK